MLRATALSKNGKNSSPSESDPLSACARGVRTTEFARVVKKFLRRLGASATEEGQCRPPPAPRTARAYRFAGDAATVSIDRRRAPTATISAPCPCHTSFLALSGSAVTL